MVTPPRQIFDIDTNFRILSFLKRLLVRTLFPPIMKILFDIPLFFVDNKSSMGGIG